MTDVDWDKVAEEANDSPRALLAEVLAKVDDITDVVILFHDKDGNHTIYQSTSSLALTIAMLSYAHWAQCHHVWEGVEHDEPA